ncbi:MAG: hypothetical protein IKE68_08300, partial [Solobacterium sp.]|nr:hypothetical protein [Solobacterium sp.]
MFLYVPYDFSFYSAINIILNNTRSFPHQSSAAADKQPCRKYQKSPIFCGKPDFLRIKDGGTYLPAGTHPINTILFMPTGFF